MNTIDLLTTAAELGRREAEIGEARVEAAGLGAPRNELARACTVAVAEGLDVMSPQIQAAYLAFVRGAGRTEPAKGSLAAQVSKLRAIAKGGDFTLQSMQVYRWLVHDLETIANSDGATADDKALARGAKAKSFDKMCEIGRAVQAADRVLTRDEVTRIVTGGMSDAETLFKTLKAAKDALVKADKRLEGTFTDMIGALATMLAPIEKARDEAVKDRELVMDAWIAGLEAEAASRRAQAEQAAHDAKIEAEYAEAEAELVAAAPVTPEVTEPDADTTDAETAAALSAGASFDDAHVFAHA
jgi:hypothetical protein